MSSDAAREAVAELAAEIFSEMPSTEADASRGFIENSQALDTVFAEATAGEMKLPAHYFGVRAKDEPRLRVRPVPQPAEPNPLDGFLAKASPEQLDALEAQIQKRRRADAYVNETPEERAARERDNAQMLDELDGDEEYES